MVWGLFKKKSVLSCFWVTHLCTTIESCVWMYTYKRISLVKPSFLSTLRIWHQAICSKYSFESLHWGISWPMGDGGTWFPWISDTASALPLIIIDYWQNTEIAKERKMYFLVAVHLHQSKSTLKQCIHIQYM